MRIIRMTVIVFFLISCICFGAYEVKEWKQSDHNAPVIQIEDDVLVVGVSATREKLLTGLTAMDIEDGDITDRIQIASLSPLVGNDERTIQYVVFDSADQLGIAERTVVYKDYIPPRIYLKEPLRFSVDNFVDKLNNLQLTATDVLDGDLSKKMRISYTGGYGILLSGQQDITFQVNNSAGDTCILPLKMTIVDPEGEKGKVYPVLSDYIVYTKVGKELNFNDYLLGLERKGDSEIMLEDVSIISKVDYGVGGIYTVDYSYTTPDNVTAVTTLFVVVEE